MEEEKNYESSIREENPSYDDGIGELQDQDKNQNLLCSSGPSFTPVADMKIQFKDKNTSSLQIPKIKQGLN